MTNITLINQNIFISSLDAISDENIQKYNITNIITLTKNIQSFDNIDVNNIDLDKSNINFELFYQQLYKSIQKQHKILISSEDEDLLITTLSYFLVKLNATSVYKAVYFTSKKINKKIKNIKQDYLIQLYNQLIKNIL